MDVRSVLAGKGGDVRSVLPWHTMAEVVQRLAEPPRVGALVVLGTDGTVVGMLGEPDVIAGLRTHGPAVFDLKAEQLMRRRVPTCGPGDPLTRVMRTMTTARCRQLPVVENGRLLGVVSQGDLVSARLREIELEAAVLRDIAIVRS